MTTADPESRLAGRLAAALAEQPEQFYRIPEDAHALADFAASVVRAAGYVETTELAGQVVIIEAGGDPDVIERRAASLLAAGASTVLELDAGQDVSTLDVEEMRAAGWERIPDAGPESDGSE